MNTGYDETGKKKCWTAARKLARDRRKTQTEPNVWLRFIGSGRSLTRPAGAAKSKWLRGLDLNQRPLGYEPNELPGCSTPHIYFINLMNSGQ